MVAALYLVGHLYFQQHTPQGGGGGVTVTLSRAWWDGLRDHLEGSALWLPPILKPFRN